jgi:hypothetical protein
MSARSLLRFFIGEFLTVEALRKSAKFLRRETAARRHEDAADVANDALLSFAHFDAGQRQKCNACAIYGLVLCAGRLGMAKNNTARGLVAPSNAARNLRAARGVPEHPGDMQAAPRRIERAKAAVVGLSQNKHRARKSRCLRTGAIVRDAENGQRRNGSKTAVARNSIQKSVMAAVQVFQRACSWSAERSAGSVYYWLPACAGQFRCVGFSREPLRRRRPNLRPNRRA